jgi:hypothetical protein
MQHLEEKEKSLPMQHLEEKEKVWLGFLLM